MRHEPEPPARLLSFCAWLISVASVIVPPRRRREWRQEWQAELWHASGRLAAGHVSRRQTITLVGRTLGAFVHALWLRQRDWSLDLLIQDVRYGLRLLITRPGFTAVAVLTLALGIGANTAVFTVIDAVLLKPLPYKDPSRLVTVWETDEKIGGGRAWASFPDYIDWRDQNHVFEPLASWQRASVNLTGGGEPERITGLSITYNFFAMLGVQPALGRTFRQEEDALGAAPVVILSHGLWQRRFGADPTIVGSHITLDGKRVTVIGVLPDGFRWLAKADLWMPLSDVRPRTFRGVHGSRVVGRLREGTSIAQAQVEMAVIARRLEKQYPESNAGRGAALEPLHEQVAGGIRPTLLILLAAVGFVLLIACANIANLLLARATAREKEVAVRAALGADRLQLLKQFLTESVLLALFGGLAGLALAYWSVPALVELTPDVLPRVEDVRIDSGVLGFTLVASLLTGVLFGLAPAIHAFRPDMESGLREGARGTQAGAGRSRLRQLLVIGETALAVVLVTGAGLLVKSFWHLQEVDPGFRSRDVVTLRIELPPTKYPEADWHRILAFYAQIVDRLRGLPEVDSVAAASSHPLDEGFTTSFEVEGRLPPAPGTEPESSFRPVTPDYFRTMGVRLLKGRTFNERDDAMHPGVTIINDAMARRFFANENPLGQRFSISWPPNAWKGVPGTYQIIGIVGNERFAGLRADAEPAMYFPHQLVPFSGMSLVVRTKPGITPPVAAIRREIGAMDSELPIFDVKTMDEIVSESVASPRFTMLLLAIFALLAVLMAAIGIYGVMAFAVGRRTHEIGVRMALGAERRDVLKMVVGQGMLQTAAGITLGLIAALIATKPMASLLYGVTTTDRTTFAAVALCLGAVGLAASYIPARRATQVDPLVALRSE